MTNDSVSPDTEQRARNVVWTMEPDAPLRMADGPILPERVVILGEYVPPPPTKTQIQPAQRRQIFLLLCLVLTSALAYLVFSGHLKF